MVELRDFSAQWATIGSDRYTEDVEPVQSQQSVSLVTETSETVSLVVDLIVARDTITRLEAARFQALADWWHEATDGIGNPRYRREHPAYRQIIALGREAIPHILGDLSARGGDWHHALHLVTGANPIPGDAYGDADRISELWLAWGRDHGW